MQPRCSTLPRGRVRQEAERTPWISELPAARPSSARRAAGSARPARALWPRPAARWWSTGATPSGCKQPPPKSPRRPAPRSPRSPPTSPRPRVRRRCSPPARRPTSWSTTMPGRRCAISASLTRQQMIDGVIANMVVAIELIQKVIDPMVERKFGRIVNITSGSVKMPLAGLDLSSGARAGLTAFLAGVARTVADQERDHQQYPAGRLRHRPAARELSKRPRSRRASASRRPPPSAHRHHSGPALRRAGRVRRGLRVSMFGAGRLHHRAELADRRRRLQRRVLMEALRGRMIVAGGVCSPVTNSTPIRVAVRQITWHDCLT